MGSEMATHVFICFMQSLMRKIERKRRNTFFRDKLLCFWLTNNLPWILDGNRVSLALFSASSISLIKDILWRFIEAARGLRSVNFRFLQSNLDGKQFGFIRIRLTDPIILYSILLSMSFSSYNIQTLFNITPKYNNNN